MWKNIFQLTIINRRSISSTLCNISIIILGVKELNSCNLENISLSVNGKKVTDTFNGINVFSDSLPPEVARLLMSQLNINPDQPDLQPVPLEDVKVRIAETMSPEAGNDPVKREIEAYLKAKKEDSLVRVIPQHVQRALDQREALEQLRNEKEKLKEFTIYESGVALGIITGQSSKQDVTKIMKKYSVVSFALTDPASNHFYSDISLYIYFDENNIVNELKFVNEYKGSTSKGLAIGDSIEKAIAIYAQPRMKSPKGAVWEKFAVFCDKEIITSIRLQN